MPYERFCFGATGTISRAGIVSSASVTLLPFTQLSGYLRVKVLGEHVSPEALSDFLRCESAFSYIDAFEGALAALHALTQSPEFGASNPILQRALATLSIIQSGSVNAVAKALGCSTGGEVAPDTLISSSQPRFDVVTLRCLHRLFPDGAPFRKYDAEPLSLTEQQIELEMLRILTGQTSAMQSLYNLRTFAAKHQFPPWATALDAWLEGLVVPDVAALGFARWASAYCVPGSGAECDVDIMDAAYPLVAALRDGFA